MKCLVLKIQAMVTIMSCLIPSVAFGYAANDKTNHGIDAAPASSEAVPSEQTITTLQQPQTLPTYMRASYKVQRGGILVGTIDEKFERFVDPDRAGERYKITSTSRAAGAIAVFYRDQIQYTSEGQISASGFTPLLFASSRKNDTARNFTTRFFWKKNEMVREHQTDGRIEQETFNLPPGTQDRLSAIYQFMVISPGKQVVSTNMTQGKNAEKYVYLKQGEPKLTTPAGEFETIHYARDVKQRESKAQMWLAKTKNFVPVRIIFEDSKGTLLEQTLIDLVIQ